MTDRVRVTVVQEPSVLLDRVRGLAEVAQQVADAAADGASLVVFGETFVPGYPDWVWDQRPGADYVVAAQLYARLLEQAVDLSGNHLDVVRDAAREHGVVVMLGVDELDGRFSGGSLYNTLVTIDADGSLANRHRKLVPTHPERMVWSPGDGAGLRPVDTAVGRIGGLICWENYMPLARYALYAQGVDVYVAPTWDEGEMWVTSMRHIAKEGRCWVVGAGSVRQVKDMPTDMPGYERLYAERDPDDWINPGDSVVVDPGGMVVAGPMHEQTGTLSAELDLARPRRDRMGIDVAGHYARPDVLSLRLDQHPRLPIALEGRTSDWESPAAAPSSGLPAQDWL